MIARLNAANVRDRLRSSGRARPERRIPAGRPLDRVVRDQPPGERVPTEARPRGDVRAEPEPRVGRAHVDDAPRRDRHRTRAVAYSLPHACPHRRSPWAVNPQTAARVPLSSDPVTTTRREPTATSVPQSESLLPLRLQDARPRHVAVAAQRQHHHVPVGPRTIPGGRIAQHGAHYEDRTVLADGDPVDRVEGADRPMAGCHRSTAARSRSSTRAGPLDRPPAGHRRTRDLRSKCSRPPRPPRPHPRRSTSRHPASAKKATFAATGVVPRGVASQDGAPTLVSAVGPADVHPTAGRWRDRRAAREPEEAARLPRATSDEPASGAVPRHEHHRCRGLIPPATKMCRPVATVTAPTPPPYSRRHTTPSVAAASDASARHATTITNTGSCDDSSSRSPLRRQRAPGRTPGQRPRARSPRDRCEQGPAALPPLARQPYVRPWEVGDDETDARWVFVLCLAGVGWPSAEAAPHVMWTRSLRIVAGRPRRRARRRRGRGG